MKITRQIREDMDFITEKFHEPINLTDFQERCEEMGLLKDTEKPKGRVTINFPNLATVMVYKDKYQIINLRQRDKCMLGLLMSFVERLGSGEEISFTKVCKHAFKAQWEKFKREDLEFDRFVREDLGIKDYGKKKDV